MRRQTRAFRGVRGFLALDAIGAIGLTLVLALVFAAAYRQFAIARHQGDARRQLRLAAEAELVRLRVAGLAVDARESDSQAAREAADGVFLSTRVRAAEGVWEGMTLVTVVARKQVYGHWVEVELSGCLGLREGRP